MKIVEPSVHLVHHTPNPERVIERFGRTCYQSTHKIKKCVACEGAGSSYGMVCIECGGTGTDIESANTLIHMIIKNGHESVLEHAVAGFAVITDRGVTHEIVRHRIGTSYSQESTRYCNYAVAKGSFDGDITFIKPPGLNIDQEPVWEAAMWTAERKYKELVSFGCQPQIARSVLPNSLKSEIGMTLNFRAWRHFLKLRCSPKAHPQMQQVANMLKVELKKLSPVCFEDIP